jgi:hypothetical protein
VNEKADAVAVSALPERTAGSTIARKPALLALSMLFNFLLPWAVYRLTVARLGETHAIMATAVVPALWSVAQFARNRKIDMMSTLVLSWIALSLVVLALGGSPKVLLFRESLITGLGGLVLIGSAMIGRPLMLVLVRYAFTSQSGLDAVIPGIVAARARAQLESYDDKRWFARVMTATTVVFGLILVAEIAVLCMLVFSLPAEKILLARPTVRNAAAGLLLLWTFLYWLPAVRRGEREDERQAAESDAS